MDEERIDVNAHFTRLMTPVQSAAHRFSITRADWIGSRSADGRFETALDTTGPAAIRRDFERLGVNAGVTP